MHSQTLHKRPSDIYSICDYIGTVYTCMNSWKEAFNPIINSTFLKTYRNNHTGILAWMHAK
jgi:hypothetical protein